jgi:hypothetical protein
MHVSNIKTNVCTADTINPKKKNGSGNKKGINPANAMMTLWSPMRFPANLIPNEKGLINIPINSKGKKKRGLKTSPTTYLKDLLNAQYVAIH